MKTFEEAAKQLPVDCRDWFIKAWKIAGCADLYDGELSSYLSVISTQFHMTLMRKEDLEKRLAKIREILDLPPPI